MVIDCKKIKESSLYVKNWLIEQVNVKEESITDWLLCDLSRKNPNIKYRSFTRNEESRKTGADWEWWIIFKSFSIKYRVQAKKIKISGNNYPSINYPRNSSNKQISLLLDSSKKENFIPLYIFYSSKGNGIVNNEGVYIKSASNIHKIFLDKSNRPSKYISSDDLLSDSISLFCFICCPFLINRGGYGFVSFFQNNFDIKYEVDKNNKLGIYKSIPDYILALLEKDNADNRDLFYEKDYFKKIENVKSILLFDLRNDSQVY